MEPFKILEHTGDAKIQAFGKTKEELFLNAMKGMETILGATKKQNDKATEEIKRKIYVKSPDLNALLVDFLSEVNYLIQTNKEVYNKAVFNKFSDTPSAGSGQAELEAELSGGESKNLAKK